MAFFQCKMLFFYIFYLKKGILPHPAEFPLLFLIVKTVISLTFTDPTNVRNGYSF